MRRPVTELWGAPRMSSDHSITQWLGHSDMVEGLVFTPDGKRLVTASRDSLIKLWDVRSGQEVLTLKGHSGGLRDIAVSPDGHLLASAGKDGTVRLWNGTPLEKGNR
jgi:eukaryotic-like serine/threonine-protein kinase